MKHYILFVLSIFMMESLYGHHEGEELCIGTKTVFPVSNDDDASMWVKYSNYYFDMDNQTGFQTELKENSRWFHLILYFYKTTIQYELTYSHKSSDDIKSIIISTGNCKINHEIIEFTDTLNHLYFTANYSGKRTIKPDNCFIHLSQQPMTNLSWEMNEKDIYWEKDKRLIQTFGLDRDYLYLILQSAKFKLPIRKPTNGSFESKDKELSLCLEKDSSYRYYVCGLLLSEGTWEQKGQRLDLHDKHLNHTFYGKITNQGIWSGYWPGDMEGTLLKRIKE